MSRGTDVWRLPGGGIRCPTCPAQALSRPIGGGDSDDPDAASTTGTGRSGEFVGRVSGQDVGYAGETGAERRQAAQEG
jgi:hypothetical protein